jgi:hypothetical protein
MRAYAEHGECKFHPRIRSPLIFSSPPILWQFWNPSPLVTCILHFWVGLKACYLMCCNQIHPDHLLLDSAPNLGPLISRWEIKNFENCWNKSVRILEVLKLLFQQVLNLSSSQQDMSGPILGNLSKNRWSVGTSCEHLVVFNRRNCLILYSYWTISLSL